MTTEAHHPFQKRFYALPDVARWAGIGKSTVLRWVQNGTFPEPVRLGPGRVAWDIHALEAWAAERRAA